MDGGPWRATVHGVAKSECPKTEHAYRSEKYMPNISKDACVHVQFLGRVRLFAIPWNVACQENQIN